MSNRINVDQLCAEAHTRIAATIERSATFHLGVMQQQNQAAEQRRRDDYVAAVQAIQHRIELAQRECNVNPVLVNAYFSTIGQRH